MIRSRNFFLLILAAASIAAGPACGAAAQQSPPQDASVRAPVNLRVEYKTDPVGIDAASPRFSWELDDTRRGAMQTGYRILVSDNPSLLAQEKGDQWDSKQVPFADTNQVAFAGHALAPWRTYYWIVRTWDAASKPSPWSAPAAFTMGPMQERDWTAKWIAPVPPRAAKAEGVRFGYHSAYSPKEDDFHYVQIDFGQPRIFDRLVIHPARPGGTAAEKGVLFPLRFKVYVDDTPDFDKKFLKIAEYTWQDVPNAGAEPMEFTFSRFKFRFVRIVVEKMQKDGDKGYAFALGELALSEGRLDIASEGVPSASDSLEENGWTLAALNDGQLLPNEVVKEVARPAAHLRHDFTLDEAPRHAWMAASALGLYEVTINGAPVGDMRLAPGWTDYATRVPYQMLDVAPYLVQGPNAIGVVLAGGWFAGRNGPKSADSKAHGMYGDQPQLRLQLTLDVAGKNVVVGTNETWRWTSAGPIRSTDLLDGENYTSKSEARGWNRANFMADDWLPVVLAERAPELFAEVVEPIRGGDEIQAVAVTEPRPHRFVYDFGQNISGVVRLRPPPVAGFPTLTLRHAEALDAEGMLATGNLGTAAQTDTVVLRPGMGGIVPPNVPPELGAGGVWEPRFTIHGFRYVEILGMEPPLTLEQVTAVPLSSDVREVGAFECSDPMLTQLWRNIAWTRRNGFLGVPLSAPQRDTREGDLGAVLPFVPTALWQADLASFFTQWMAQVRAAQSDDGRFGDVAPRLAADASRLGTPGSADAGVFVPWEAYLHYHDLRLLSASVPSMTRWIDFVKSKNKDLVWKEARGADLGDRFNGSTLTFEGWKAEGGEVPRAVLATAFFARSCEITAKAAFAAQRTNDAERMAGLAADVRRAFRAAYVAPDGRIEGDTQAGYALALDFGLLEEEPKLEDMAVAHLVRKIDEAGGALTTGMHTTHRALLALSLHGHHDRALKLAQRRAPPSWGSQIDAGATTTWERWDAYVPGRGFADPATSSLDSVAFGSIGEWMMRTIGGIEIDDAHATSGPVRLMPILDGPTRSSAEGPRAFEHVRLRPRIEGNITWAKAEHTSIAGRIAVAWRVEGATLTCECTLPPNTSATLELPAKDKSAVKEGGHPVAEVKGLDARRFENGHVVIDVPAGTWSFTSTLR